MTSGVGYLSGYLNPDFSDGIKEISVLGLAHIGDAVFELMVRTWLCSRGAATAKKLHGGSVGFVSAKAQAAAAGRILPSLSEAEMAVFRRGRNARVNSTPRGSSYEEYHFATGVEALFGYLYLIGRKDRVEELFELVINEQGMDK